MHAGPNHIVGQDGGVLFVSGHGGDDLGSLNGSLSATAFGNLETVPGEISCAFIGCARVDIVKPQLIDAAYCLERQRLKFRLCAVADHRHGSRALRGKVLGRHGRGCRCAQRGEDSHL